MLIVPVLDPSVDVAVNRHGITFNAKKLSTDE